MAVKENGLIKRLINFIRQMASDAERRLAKSSYTELTGPFDIAWPPRSAANPDKERSSESASCLAKLKLFFFF